MSFFTDLFSGNFTGAYEDIVKGLQSLPAPVQAFIVKLEGDAGALLQTLAEAALQDVVAGGFTTASFVAAAKDVVSKGLAQGQTILISDAMAQINILASSVRPVVAVDPVPVAE